MKSAARRGKSPMSKLSNPSRPYTTPTKPNSSQPPSKKARRSRTPTSRASGSAKRSSPGFSTQQLRNDRLGTLVRQLCEKFTSAESWEAFVNAFRGPSYLSSELDDLDHPAAALLRKWRDEGVPAETYSKPWTREQKDECIARGCHYSANEHADFIREEMAGFLEDRFWMVLPYVTERELVRGVPYSYWRYL